MGSDPAVGAVFFSGEENWCLLQIRSRYGLRFTTEHSCLVHLIITPCISCLPYAREPEAQPLGWLALKICASPKPAANKYQASAWSPKQTQEFELYSQASSLAEWLCVPSGKRMNVGSNPAVGAGFFLARKTGACYGYGAGVALVSQQSIHA